MNDPAAIADRFFGPDGRLTSVPRKYAKLLLVLDRLAREFEPARAYPEVEVAAVLTRFHEDHAALRRYLVEAGFLTREHGIYRRHPPAPSTGAGRDGAGR